MPGNLFNINKNKFTVKASLLNTIPFLKFYKLTLRPLWFWKTFIFGHFTPKECNNFNN